MQLNRFTDYGLRVLIYLSSHSPEQRVSLEFLAENFNINKHHLHKVSQRLSQLGWISSARGKNGGISIKAATLSLTLAEIINELEPDMTPIDCSGANCPIVGACKLQDVLDQAGAAFLDVLSKYRLEDLQISDLTMVRLLNAETEPCGS